MAKSKLRKIMTIVGARPQFVKAAAISRAVADWNRRAEGRPLSETIVHTGQHYDEKMSAVFFEELQIPKPAVNLEVGSGLHGQQTGVILQRLEPVLLADRPDLVLIYGDTNSTLAGALAAAKLSIPVVHVEAGLRSFNRQMPEEVNRVVADHLSALLLCPTVTAVENLRREGITAGVHQVGDVMYDSVLFNRELSRSQSDVIRRLKLTPRGFFLATIHRAENTDEPERLSEILAALGNLDLPVVLPLHPRTLKTLGNCVKDQSDRILLTEPMAYLDMLALEENAALILTDSGGVQKEAYFLGVPCVTLREETEWVELVEAGWNVLVGADRAKILRAAQRMRQSSLPPVDPARLYGTGHAAETIVALLASSLADK
jgi:UDP-N-acetylglucosamine 2-epimerase